MDLETATPPEAPPAPTTPLEEAVHVHVDATGGDLAPPEVNDGEAPELAAPGARASKASKSAAGEFSVFDAPVQDRPNARPRGAAKPAPKKGAKGKPAAGGTDAAAATVIAAATAAAPAPLAPELKEKCRKEATGMVRMYDAHMRMTVRSRYQDVLEEKSLDELEQKVALSQDEIDLLVDPITDGMEEMGARMPWWARLGIAAVMVNKSRQALLGHVERQYQAHQKQLEAKAQLEAPRSAVAA